ncbi:MAG: hypothetical protein KKD13_00730 [Candidatus Margulisbacteria bacterium]|nr:hypothetical protein [Candidatus Margulisiibacteriota bacterium]
MSIKIKTILIVFISFVVFYIATDLVANKVIFSGFTKLEQDYALNDMGRILYFINDTFSRFNETAEDWAAWDDTYEFIDNNSQAYKSSNLSPQTFQSLHLDLILFCDNQGKVIYAMQPGETEDQLTPLTPEKEKIITDNYLCNQTEHQKQGVSLFPEGAFLLVANQIVKSDRSGPGRGTLIMGRFIGPDLIKRLTSITNLSTTAHPLNNPALSPEIANILTELNKSPIALKTINKDKLFGYLLLNDIAKKPALVFKVESPRILSFQSEIFSSLLSLVRAGAFFLCALVILILLQKTILSPLDKINKLMAKIIDICQLTAVNKSAPCDEIDQLKHSAEALLEELNHRHPENKALFKS